MNYSNSTESYMRSIAKIGVRQNIKPRELFDLSGWLMLWKPVGKVLLVMFPFILLINVFVAAGVTKTDQLIVTVDNQRHELMDKNIELLAKRAKAWSSVNIEKLAGKEIALQARSGNQWNWFDKDTGIFTKL